MPNSARQKAHYNTAYDSDSTAPDVDELECLGHYPSSPPTSLEAPISPPCKRRKLSNPLNTKDKLAGLGEDDFPSLADVEAGEARIKDHLEYFSEHLSKYVNKRGEAERPEESMELKDWKYLYRRNCHAHGRHFVVHQHDHPIAGR